MEDRYEKSMRYLLRGVVDTMMFLLLPVHCWMTRGHRIN